jgi:hypothetical protein
MVGYGNAEVKHLRRDLVDWRQLVFSAENKIVDVKHRLADHRKFSTSIRSPPD